MDKILKNFVRKIREINLLPEEKARIRGVLLSHVHSHPVREFNSRFFWAKLPLPVFRYAPIVSIFLILLTSVGIAVAAEGSLPGDALYPMRVNVTENVRSLLSFSQEGKAEWEIKRADRRLEDVEKLATQGRLEAGIAAEAESKFKDHVDNAVSIVSRMKEENKDRDAARIQSDLKTVLLVHEDILERIKSHDGDRDEKLAAEVKSLHGEVKNKAEDTTESLSRAEEGIRSASGPDIKAAAEGKFTAAENKLIEVKKFIEDKKGQIDDQSIEEAKKLSKEAEKMIANGKSKMEDEAYGEAFVIFQKSIRLNQAAKQMVGITSVLPEVGKLDGSGFSEKIKFSESKTAEMEDTFPKEKSSPSI